MMRFSSHNNIVAVVCESKTFTSAAKKIARALDAALFFEKKRNISCAVHLVRDASMRHINKESRNKDAVTNVLSFEDSRGFPHPEAPKDTVWHGDIFLAPHFITKKNEDIVFLALHGLLHLLGYTHEKKNDRMVMEAREKEVLLFISRTSKK
jgi:probable rRNA maturation factor